MSINTRPNHVCLSSFKKTLVKLHCFSSKHNAIEYLVFQPMLFSYNVEWNNSDKWQFRRSILDLKCQDNSRKHCLKLDIVCNVLYVCVQVFLALTITITQTDGQINVVPAIWNAANPYANIIQVYLQFVDRNHHPHSYSRWTRMAAHIIRVHMGAGLFTCCLLQLHWW